MGIKTIILVRHGQYHAAAENKTEQLTTLGKQQARYVAKRLKENKIDQIFHSTMPRAVETAQIIKNQLNYRGPFEATDLLREGTPVFPKKLRKKHGHTDLKKMKTHRLQLEKALKKFFKPSRKNRVEVLVCHGNVIRYIVCRFLEIDPHLFLKMDILQCAISVFEIKTTGRTKKKLISHNDVGHIPKNKRTFL